MDSEPENLDHVLIALADPTRRAILLHLSGGPARVTEVAAPFDISLNSVSKHVRILERADLVVRFPSGREHILTLNTAPIDRALSWLGAQQGSWRERLEAVDFKLGAADPEVIPPEE